MGVLMLVVVRVLVSGGGNCVTDSCLRWESNEDVGAREGLGLVIVAIGDELCTILEGEDDVGHGAEHRYGTKSVDDNPDLPRGSVHARAGAVIKLEVVADERLRFVLEIARKLGVFGLHVGGAGGWMVAWNRSELNGQAWSCV
jgi:hypothetical protein